MGDSVNCGIGGDVRFDSNSKMKTSPPMESSVSCSDKVIILSKNIPIISSVGSAEPAKVSGQSRNLEIQNIDLTGFKFKEGLITKIDNSLDLTFPKLCFVFTSLYFSTLGAEEFRTIVERRWEEVRSKPSNPEQTWLIPSLAGTLGEILEPSTK